jgi:alpha-tubulin suppressor-like RCC1 family protein
MDRLRRSAVIVSIAVPTPSPTSRSYARRTAIASVLALSLPLFADAQPLPSGSGIRHAATRSFTLVVKADGSVVGWGRDPDGQAARPPSPRRVITTPVPIDLPGKALQVALGDTMQYALLEDGTVVSWGTNDEGQLGNGPMGATGRSGLYPAPSVTPVKVTGLTGVIQIAAGMKHAIALRSDGTVWAWGRRSNGEIGDGDGHSGLPAIGPTRVPGLDGIKQIAADGSHNLALRSDGHVMAWGLNHSGELGTGTRDKVTTPVEVKGLDRVVAIAAGTGGSAAGSSGAVRDDGTVWMWGTGMSAMTGNDPGLSPDDAGGRVLEPMPIKGITGARRLSIGSGHVAVLLADGTLRLWGFDGYGQTGVGTSGTSSEIDGAYKRRPVKPAITNVASIYLGGYRSLAVRTDGTLWIWGFAAVTSPGILGRNLKVPTWLDLEAIK